MAEVAVEWLTGYVTGVFRATGVPEEAAEVVAGALVDADRRGLPSHGVALVPMYVDRLRHGSVRTHASAAVVVDAGAVAVLDAGHALGQLTADQGMALAIRKAWDHGIGAVTVRHAFHFGAAGRYARTAALAGVVGFAAANTRPMMPAPGGARAVVGNNPIAVGIPAGQDDPIVLDFALSEVALGRIRMAAASGTAIPDTWATDADGRPTTDPAAAIAGLLLPAGGHKGFALALAVEVLTGVLSGGGYGDGVQGLYADPTVPNDSAHFFLALDVAAFGDPEGFARRVHALARSVTSSPTAPGVDRVRLPGERSTGRWRAAAHRVAVDDRTLGALREVAASLDIAEESP